MPPTLIPLSFARAFPTPVGMNRLLLRFCPPAMSVAHALGDEPAGLAMLARVFRCSQKATGFRGSLRVVAEWATPRRRSEMANKEQMSRVPSARTLARLMTTGRDMLSKSETVNIAAIEGSIPAL